MPFLLNASDQHNQSGPLPLLATYYIQLVLSLLPFLAMAIIATAWLLHTGA